MNMTWFFDLLSTALYTVFIQNLVFNGGYAASEALMLAKKPRRLWMFSAMIAFFSTVTALACRALEMIPVLSTLPSALHFAMFSGVLIVVFLITGLILKLALGAFKTTEGCLTRDEESKVTRFDRIKVAYDELADGALKPRKRDFTGWTAQVIQHMIDHCKGKLV